MNANAGEPAEHRVVVFAAPEEPDELAEVLHTVLGLHLTDAMVRARNVPGLLPDALTAGQAAQLAAAIQGLGLSAEAKAAAELPDLREGQAAHHCKCTPNGLEVLGLTGGVQVVVPWNRIDLVCAGVVPQEGTRHYPTGEMAVLSAARRTPRSRLDIPATSGPELWIVSREPDHIWRIDHKRMNYEYLGDRKTESATVNFHTFLQDLVQFVPGAYLPPSTRALLANGPERLTHFASSEDLGRYAQFHLLIHRHPPLPPQEST